MSSGLDTPRAAARACARILVAALALAACGDGAGATDSGASVEAADGGADGSGAPEDIREDGAADAGAGDAGVQADAGVADAGADAGDAGEKSDAGDADALADAAAPLGDPLSWPVDADGPYVVGYRVLHATYTPPGGLPPRTIEVHVWYPATEPTAETPTYLGLFPDPKVFVDAPLAPSPYPAGHPVLVHSHGHKGFAGNSAELMRYVASHGWVAVAPEHLGNTLLDTPEPRPLAIYLQRPLDVRAALDLVFGLQAPDPLAGALDPDRIGMSGHSFGTYTTWAVAGATFDMAAIEAKCAAGQVGECTDGVLAAFAEDLTDPRPLVFVPMAGGRSDLFAADGLDAVTAPMLLMTGSLDQVGADALFDGISGVDLTWVEVEGGCHQLFGLGNAVLGDAGCKALPDDEGFAIVDTWLLAMLRAHALGDASVASILDGSAPVSPLVTVKHKAP